MNNKGFTLVELLGVVVILAIVSVIAISNISNMSEKAQDKMFRTKIDNIETAAKLYGQNNLNTFTEDVKDIEGVKKGVTIPISKLVETNYLKSESSSYIYISDPVDNSNIASSKIKLYLKNNHVYVKFPIPLGGPCEKETYTSKWIRVKYVCKEEPSMPSGYRWYSIGSERDLSECEETGHKVCESSIVGEEIYTCIPWG